LYLVITRALARMPPIAESETPFPNSVTHHPKAVLAGGWWLGWLTEAIEPHRMSAEFQQLPEESIGFLDVLQYD